MSATGHNLNGQSCMHVAPSAGAAFQQLPGRKRTFHMSCLAAIPRSYNGRPSTPPAALSLLAARSIPCTLQTVDSVANDYVNAQGPESYWQSECNGDLTYDPYNACRQPQAAAAAGAPAADKAEEVRASRSWPCASHLTLQLFACRAGSPAGSEAWLQCTYGSCPHQLMPVCFALLWLTGSTRGALQDLDEA